MGPLLPTAAGLISGCLVDVLQFHHVVPGGQESYIEWTAWALLTLFSWLRRRSRPMGSGDGSTGLLESWKFASILQSTAVSEMLIACSSFLSLLLWRHSFEYIWWSTPIVSIAVTSFYQRHDPLLPRLWHEPFVLTGWGEKRRTSSWSMSRRSPAWWLYAIMLISSCFLALEFNTLSPSTITIGVLYILLQSLVFILLRDGYHNKTDLWANSPVFGSCRMLFLLWTVYNLCESRSFPFQLQPLTLIVGLLRFIQLQCIISLAAKDPLLGPVASSTTTLVSSLASYDLSRTGRVIGFALALVAIMHLLNMLPASTGRRKLLLLCMVPFCISIGMRSARNDPSQTTLAGQVTLYRRHPIEVLSERAQARFAGMLSSQSKTLEEAVVTYKKRFNRDPPAGFDMWFELAQKYHYSLVDEFDTIMESLEPFWGIDPSLMRWAIESVPDTAPGMVRISIKNHQIEEKATHRGIYHANIVDRWLEKPGWLDVLPDMTILVNRYDEPRVVAPSDALLAAREAAMSTSATRKPPREATELSWFDCARRDLRETILSACPANSPSRDETTEKMAPIQQDEAHSLPFVHSVKESQDVCNNPIIHRSHGFFTSPTTCSITESLLPVFSPCKPSIFNDILYPPIWYWLKLIQDDYDEDDDMEWSEKKDLVYWTGSATGGWATLGNWRTLHRQSLVLQTTSQNTSATILQRHSAEEDVWQAQTTPMSNLSHLFDLRITSIPPEQCESSACDAMRHAFLKRDPTYVDPPREEEEGTDKSFGSGPRKKTNPNSDPLSAAYGAKYVLDMDGNAFSGRFYRLLLSKSAVLKQTVFQEWHDGRLVPWVHFIPISPEAEELAEVVRYLSEDERGKEIGERIARQGREWAQKTLRMVDLELTMLRVLMEYGRLVSDHRQEMGFTF